MIVSILRFGKAGSVMQKILTTSYIARVAKTVYHSQFVGAFDSEVIDILRSSNVDSMQYMRIQ